MDKNKIFFSGFNYYVKKIITSVLILFIFFIFVLFVIAIINKFDQNILIHKVDNYLKTIITSWPAVVLILGLIFLMDQHDAIEEFVGKRITHVGRDGVTAALHQEGVALKNQQEETEHRTEEPVIQPSTEVIPVQEVNYEFLYNHFKDLYFFENNFNLMFGSQLRLLNILKPLGSTGMPYEDVAAYYGKVAIELWVGTEIWTTEKYLGFLEERKLIEKIQHDANINIKITTGGIKFLDYIQEKNYVNFFKPL